MILKHSKTKWIEIDWIENLKIKLSYPTPDQMEELWELYSVMMSNNPNYLKKAEDENIKLTDEQFAKEKRIALKVAKFFIKSCIKDWEGVTSEAGDIVECKIIKDDVEQEILKSFLSNFNYPQIIKLGTLIESEVEFSEADKKK